MIVFERFLAYRRRHRGGAQCHCVHRSEFLPFATLNFADVPRHQFNFCIFKSLAALVVHCHPANKIEQIAFLRGDDVVIGFPTHPAGDVSKLGVHLGCLIGLQLPLNCGLQNCVVSERRKQRLTRKRETKFPIDFDDRLRHAAALISHRRLCHGVALPVALHCFLTVPRVTAAHDFSLHNHVRFVRFDDKKIDRFALK